MLKGIAASDGIGIGKAFIIKPQTLSYNPRTVTDTEAETERFNNAVDEFCGETEVKVEALRKNSENIDADIISGHISMARDPYMLDEVRRLIREGKCAESAFETICDNFIAVFSSAEEDIIRQRAADMKDVKAGVLRCLLGIKEMDPDCIPEGAVIVARELTPSMTAGMKKENIAAMITETGSSTSHCAIIARLFEIPSVMSIAGLMRKVNDGDMIICDGTSGEVFVSPDEGTLKSYTEKRDELIRIKNELEPFRGLPTRCKSGRTFRLMCNIGSPDDVRRALDADCEGVGLFRTEFMFMNRNTLPTEEQQFEEYKKTALMLNHKPLVIRTIDIGGDKDIPYMGLEKENNPYMGCRAVRYCLKMPSVFKAQIRAILRAGAFGNVSMLIPMITCEEELLECKKMIQTAKDELKAENEQFDPDMKVGVMIETASAAVIADILAEECDFFSIGSNDLTGYTMCCDRGNSSVDHLYSPFQPGVLRLIKHTIDCAKKKGIPVELCGEAAAYPMMIPLLISYGLDSFSVSPPSVLKVRHLIDGWDEEQTHEISDHVNSLRSCTRIIEYLSDVTNNKIIFRDIT